MSGIYADRQRQRDAEYSNAYEAWFASLPPSQRTRLTDAGLSEPDTAGRAHGKDVDLDVERMADAHSTERSGDFQLALAEAFSELCHYFVMPPGQRGLNAKAIGQRVIMAMWVMRPDIIGNLSTTEIGALVDARPEVLSRQATAFSKRFGIRGRAQFSEKTRMAQRAAKLKRKAGNAVEAAQKPPSDPSLN